MHYRHRVIRLPLIIWLWASAAVLPSHSNAQPKTDGLSRRVSPLLRSHRGTATFAVKHLKTGEQYEFDGAKPMPTASLIKLPIMIEAYRQAAAGQVDLNVMITLQEKDKVPGSGILTQHFSSGSSISLRDAIRLMIVYSDNTATNLVVDKIGIQKTAETMLSLKLPNTKLHSKVFRRDTSQFPERSKRFGLGSTTATEMITLLEMLYNNLLASPSATEEMVEHLVRCDDKSKLSRDLPLGTRIAHKSGAVTRVRTAAGIIYSPSGPYAICVLTADNEDRRWVNENAANELCARLSLLCYRYFNPITTPNATIATVLSSGSSGRMVEDLQRTLNVRLKPSPELSVDGDFGPATLAAVKRFQQSKKIASDGIVDTTTWQALGSLVTSNRSVPSPEIINNTVQEVQQRDPLNGPPIVSAKAWAIADGSNGEILWEKNANQTRDIASTTKIMTAYIVLSQARKDPAVLNETVTFSERADKTPGSTAGIRAGESLSVGELLFGLMLPSGNDASVALAEHFGSRFEPSSEKPNADDPLQRFIAEMNRTATRLGMMETFYENPHGLTATRHKSSARDLITLAHAAFKLPDFKRYVRTRARGTTVKSVSGYTRNVAWNNTNKLLPIEGYNGIKTGTTSAAGACLVSSGVRDDRHLFLVVLGSTSSDGRYVDTRNLFRWAWQQSAEQETRE